MSISPQTRFPSSVGALVAQGHTAAQAWRIYLGLTTVELAARARLPPNDYTRLERSPKLRECDAWILASALGVWVTQLDAKRLIAAVRRK